MSDLWEEFQALPEEPGVKISREEAIGKSLDETQFLYMFQGPKKAYFKVFQGEKGHTLLIRKRRIIIAIEILIILNILLKSRSEFIEQLREES